MELVRVQALYSRTCRRQSYALCDYGPMTPSHALLSKVPTAITHRNALHVLLSNYNEQWQQYLPTISQKIHLTGGTPQLYQEYVNKLFIELPTSKPTLDATTCISQVHLLNYSHRIFCVYVTGPHTHSVVVVVVVVERTD